MAVAFRRHRLSASYSYSTYAAELSEDREIFNSDNDDDLPSVRQILASPKRVINLTYDDNSDSEEDDGNHIEINWLRYTRTAQHRVTLNFTLLNRRLPGRRPTPFTPPTVLPAKLAGTHRRWPLNVVCSSHTWQETPLDQCPSVVLITPQTSTALRQAS